MAGRPKAEMVEILSGVPLFATLSRSEVNEVAKLCEERTYQAGETIMKQLEDAQLMVAIISGRAKVVRDGHELAVVSDGDAVGEMSLIDGHRRSASVVAETPVELVVLHRSTFLKLLDHNPSIAKKLLIAQTARLREADKRLSALG